MLEAIKIEIKENEIILIQDIGDRVGLKERIQFGNNIKIKFDTDKFKECSRCKSFYKDLKNTLCPECFSYLEYEEEFMNFKKSLEKSNTSIINKEKQEFQIGDIAYMIDEDYNLFESEVYRIEIVNGKYSYYTHDCDFEFKDINKWVFKSEMRREMYLYN